MPSMRNRLGFFRRLTVVLSFSAPIMFGDCLDSEMAKRFRETYLPGLVDGLSAAVTQPESAEDGLRQAGVALIEGIGAALQPRTPSSSSQ